MSIIDRECAERTSGLICTHIAQFYPHAVGDPIIFCFIDDSEFPDGTTITSTLSDTNDKCHREADGVADKKIKKSFRARRSLQGMKICDGGNWRDIVPADIAKIVDRYR